MMASGKSAKQQRRSVPVVSQREGLPWLAISAGVVILALISTIFIVVYGAKRDKDNAAAAEAAIVEQLKPWEPTSTNKDPSTAIADIYVGDPATYKVGLHVDAPTRVAYDRYPPVGGPHDSEWAACNGVVYPVAVRNENMVHTLEHGAIWITYNPDTIAAGDLDILKKLVEGRQYISMSPYPGLSKPISLQAWAHQLFVDSASDQRIRQFMTALQRNPNTTPEVNGTCSQPTFDTANPPAFVADPPGADAVQMNGTGGTSGAVVTQSTEGAVVADPSASEGATTAASVEPSGSAEATTAGSAPAAQSSPAATETVAPSS